MQIHFHVRMHGRPPTIPLTLVIGKLSKEKKTFLNFLQDFGVNDDEEEAHDDDDKDDYDNDKNDGAYHDCEKDEIVKWFPLYEGDAMFPARKSNVKRERLNKIEIRKSCKRDNK